MTVLWMDGFDHYTLASESLKKWTTERSSTGGGTSESLARRSGSRRIDLSGNTVLLTKDIPERNKGPLTIGTGFRYAGDNPTDWGGIHIMSGSVSQLYLYGDDFGTLYVLRGGSNPGTVGVVPNALVKDQWQFIELTAYIDSAAGSFDVYVDGINVISSGTIDTQGAGDSDIIDGVRIKGDCWYDDLYVTDGDRLGDIRIDTILPTASGTYYNDWVASPVVDHNLNVDDPISSGPDNDTTYNASDVVGSIDSYKFTSPSLSGDIYAVQFNLYTRRDQPGIRWAGSIYREDSTDYEGNSGQLFDAYDFDSITLWNSPPSGLSPQWTEDYITYSGEFGIKVIV